jgi:uncharacterized protein (DUF427 family)
MSQIRVERGQKRVRALLGGEVVADTIRPLLVWENPHYPVYYIPADDVHAKLVPAGDGQDEQYDVVTAQATAPAAARRYPDSPAEELREAVRLDWSAMDEWLEEDEPVYVHPRDPYTRVDILASSRHVRVERDGVTLADSHSPRILFETGLVPRYYLPMTDVRIDLLHPSERQTRCPYKGTAGYFSVQIGERMHKDLVWIYRSPLPESQKIAGLVCFYNERVDLFIDGVRQPR